MAFNQLQTLDVRGFSSVHVEEYYAEENITAWENTPEQVKYFLYLPASRLKKRILDLPKCKAAWNRKAVHRE